MSRVRGIIGNVDTRQVIRLIEGAIPREAGVWADLGCGDGVFTLALAERIGPEGRIYAVDKDPRALTKLKRRVGGHAVIPVPYPIAPARLAQVTVAAGLSTPEITGTLPSAFSGVLYAAFATPLRNG